MLGFIHDVSLGSAVVVAIRLTNQDFGVQYRPQAEVAELADALRSGRSGGSPVWVQVPPSA